MEFMLGCNYWASNAGAEMWVQWDASIVEEDLKKLSAHGLQYLRVFPNWRDFQPVCGFYGHGNDLKEYRHKDGNFFNNPYYVDEKMMGRFADLCNIAEKYGIKLIVGLLTGWMSGRTFTPPLLEGRNLYTDETALVMEQKFIKGFVSYFGDTKAIYAWDLGNECNCLSHAHNREVACAWTASMANAIRAHDPLRRPVISGMHSLGIDTEWNVFDQGENVDILTTHPYPHFVKYCFKDDMVSFRTLLHATCEGVYYSDLGGKPCLTEEIGTLGPMVCDEETSAAFLKTNLYSNWAHGSLGVFWWCTCEQVELKSAPYSWCMLERELGLLDRKGAPKKTLLAYKAFADWLGRFGRSLPEVHTDAVCVLTRHQPHWGVAYMSYALAKQAHVNLRFVYDEQRVLPESDVYLLPAVTGSDVICKETFDLLLEKAYNGATLYLSNNTGWLAEFEYFTGVHIKNSKMMTEQRFMQFGEDGIAFQRKKKYMIESAGAEVLAEDDQGMAAFTKYSFGKGTVYYLNFPLETMLLEQNDAFDSEYYKIYETVFSKVIKEHPIMIASKWIGMTCHYKGDACDVVLINYSSQEQEIGLTVNETYEIAEVFDGVATDVIPANEAIIITLRKK